MLTVPVRLLGDTDATEVRRLLDAAPFAGAQVAERVSSGRMAWWRHEARIFGYGRKLSALCWVGANVVPVSASQPAAVAFAELVAGEPRGCSSIVGSAEAVLPELLAACAAGPLVAHTAWFDVTLINRAAARAGLPPLRDPVLDIGALAHALFPSWWDLSLEGLGRLMEVEMVDRHTARGDALTAGLIFLRMIPRLEERGVRTLSGALRLQRRRPAIVGGPGPSGSGLSGP